MTHARRGEEGAGGVQADESGEGRILNDTD